MKSLSVGMIVSAIILFLSGLALVINMNKAPQPTVLVLAPYDSVKASDLKCETQDKSPLFLLDSIVLADSLGS